MPLFHVQDSDRPMWVIGKDWQDALSQWKKLIAAENKGETGEPQGIQHVGDDDELIVWGFPPLPLTRDADETEFAIPTPEVLKVMSDFSAGHRLCDRERREITNVQPSDDGRMVMAQFYHDDSEWFPLEVSEICAPSPEE
jgi:hypothetical protein